MNELVEPRITTPPMSQLEGLPINLAGHPAGVVGRLRLPQSCVAFQMGETGTLGAGQAAWKCARGSRRL